ncbi:MAG: M20/M25/M40 family metallo-hydrolase, partial [Bacilli bacterium]
TIKTIAKLHDVQVDMKLIHGYSSVHNDNAAFENMNQAVLKATGHEITIMPPLMGSEDFSAYTNVKPGCFIFVGGGSDEGYQYGNHHPKFRIHQEALRIGCSIHIAIILDLLKK